MSPRDVGEPVILTSHDSFTSVELKNAVFANESDDLLQTNDTRKNVRFSFVETRLYSITIGDNPSVQVGVPITLTWNFTEIPAVAIDEYEESRTQGNTVARLSSITRKNLLHRVYGHTEEEIADAENEILLIKRQRLLGNKTTKPALAVESSVRRFGKASRKLGRNVLMALSATSRMTCPGLMVQI